ncbi:MAG: sugar transferase [Anaerolineales bacterium]|nr:sugar transferase [Anaerolineales bacterium]
MFRRFSTDFALFSILLDGFLILLSLFAASVLRPMLNTLPLIKEVFGYQSFPDFLYLVFPAVWVLSYLVFSVYNPGRNLRSEEEFVRLILGSLQAGIALAGVLFFTYRDFSRALFLSFFGLGCVSTIGWRVLYIGLRLSGYSLAPNQNVLIIGAGLVGKDLQQKIAERQDLRLRLAGFLDDDPQKRAGNPLILDVLDNARRVVQEYKVDHVIMALPRRAHERLSRLVSDLHDLPVKVYVIPDYFALTMHHAAVEEFAGIPVLDLRAPALSDYQRLVKRAFDVTATLLLLPVSLPMMGLIGLAVRLESRGPVLLHQTRVGENGRLFKMHKFRTMVENAEALRHLVERRDNQGRLIHKAADDPRTTRLGGLLRRLSLDELPQFFNILRGEMSLVGPRPEMPYLVDQYEPWQRKRFAVPPGLTGWWQVHGRSDKPMHLHTEEDLYYIQNYSPWLDILIILKTVGAVFSRRGAY